MQQKEKNETERKNRRKTGTILLSYQGEVVASGSYLWLKHRKDIIARWHKRYNMKQEELYFTIIPD
jgi:hypothetical protein